MFKKVKGMATSGYTKLLKMKIHRDQKAGPAIEEIGLIVFIALVIISQADGLGTIISNVFTVVGGKIQAALGVTTP